MEEEHVPTGLEYQQGYERLVELFKQNRIKKCIRQTEEYLLDWRTPFYERAMAHLILAGSTDDWDYTESHRASAENIYRVTRNQHYPTSDDPSVEANLTYLRHCLDRVRDYQASHEPSFESGSEDEAEEFADEEAEWVTDDEEEQEEVKSWSDGQRATGAAATASIPVVDKDQIGSDTTATPKVSLPTHPALHAAKAQHLRSAPTPQLVPSTPRTPKLYPRNLVQNRPNNFEVYTSGPSHVQISTPPHQSIEFDVTTLGASRVRLVASQSPTRSPTRSSLKSVPTTPTASLQGKATVVSSVNGPSVNGPSFNGPSFNGPSVNGPSFNGPSFNGERASLLTNSTRPDRFNLPEKRKIHTTSWPTRSQFSSSSSPEATFPSYRGFVTSPPKRSKVDEQSYPVRLGHPKSPARKHFSNSIQASQPNAYSSYVYDDLALDDNLPLHQGSVDSIRDLSSRVETGNPLHAGHKLVNAQDDFVSSFASNADHGNNVRGHQELEGSTPPHQTKSTVKELVKKFER